MGGMGITNVNYAVRPRDLTHRPPRPVIMASEAGLIWQPDPRPGIKTRLRLREFARLANFGIKPN